MTEFVEGDLLEGAEAIAAALYGADKAKAKRRRVFYMHEKKLLPTFSMGSVICARRSTLAKFLEQQEQAGGAADA